MLGFNRNRIRRKQLLWIIIAITAMLLLFAGLLAVNIASHGYESQQYYSPTYNVTASWFPEGFLRGSLAHKSYCNAMEIGQGDGKPQTHGVTEHPF